MARLGAAQQDVGVEQDAHEASRSPYIDSRLTA
jgi:hypothetical protein